MINPFKMSENIFIRSNENISIEYTDLEYFGIMNLSTHEHGYYQMSVES